MNIDMTTLTETAASKVWDEISGAEDAPFEEQNVMVQYSVKSKVLPVVNVIVPVVETALKEKLVNLINEAHDAGHDSDFTLMALMAELSDD